MTSQTCSSTRNAITRTSSPLVFTVRNVSLTLPAPSVREAPDNVLVPIENVPVNVVINYDKMSTTDSIVLIWDGTRYPARAGEAGGTVTVPVNRPDIIKGISRSINVIYEVTHKGVTDTSGVLTLKVDPPALNAHGPIILEANNTGQLNITGLVRDATVVVNVWPFMAVGQKISLRFEGTGHDGGAYNWSHPTWQNFAVGSVSQQQAPVALSTLRQLKNNSTLTLYLTVAFNDGSAAVSFPLKSYTVQSGLDFGSNYTFPATNYVVATSRNPVYPPAGAMFTRTAQGGTPPYTYSSQNPTVATINNSGLITVWRNGTAYINATDASGVTGHFLLTVTGVKTMQDTGGLQNWATALQTAASWGGRLASTTEMQQMYDMYARENADVATLLNWPLARSHPNIAFGIWSNQPASAGWAYFMNICNVRSGNGQFVDAGQTHAPRPVIVLKET
ncbi:hypothetical protein KU43P_17750 [Pseudomonas sp. KU43P]|nr:hypothetical protein KU43P_17750 [Pseudomonas sp. KU43P]